MPDGTDDLLINVIAPIVIDGSGRRFGSASAAPLMIYQVHELRPTVPGPWIREADKIAWTDPSTGMACIIRRSAHGHLCGYVAVEPEHPLYGYEVDALPRDPALIVHGGMSHAQACEHRRPIATSVWRRPPTPDAPPAWWFGFECNHGFDDAPGRAPRIADESAGPSSQIHFDGGVIAPVYRNEAYVYRGCVYLAAQLDAVAKGLPMPILASNATCENEA